MIYKRKGEEIVKVCDECETSWKDSWLERHQDENECPFCGAEFEDGQEERTLDPIKNKPKDALYYLRMRLIKAEEELFINQAMLFKLESTPTTFSAAMHGWDEPIESIKGRHVKDLGKIAKLRMRNVNLHNFIAETNGQIDKLRVIYTRKEEKI